MSGIGGLRRGLVVAAAASMLGVPALAHQGAAAASNQLGPGSLGPVRPSDSSPYGQR
jgi:hypothetical protein